MLALPFDVLSSWLSHHRYLSSVTPKDGIFPELDKRLPAAVSVYQEKFRFVLFQSRRVLTAHDNCDREWPPPEKWFEPHGLAAVAENIPALAFDVSLWFVALVVVYHSVCNIASCFLDVNPEQIPGRRGYPSFTKFSNWLTKLGSSKVPREILHAFAHAKDEFETLREMRDVFLHRDAKTFIGYDETEGFVFTDISIAGRGTPATKVVKKPLPILPTLRHWLRMHLETGFRLESYALSRTVLPGWKTPGGIDFRMASLERIFDADTDTFGVEEYVRHHDDDR